MSPVAQSSIFSSVITRSVVFLSVFATLAFLSLANLASSSFFSINKISLRSLPTPCKYRVSEKLFPNLESNYESNTVQYYIRGNFLTRLIHCITHNTFCQLIISHKFNNNLLLLQNFFFRLFFKESFSSFFTSKGKWSCLESLFGSKVVCALLRWYTCCSIYGAVMCLF